MSEPTHRERVTGITLESIEDILWGKPMGRILEDDGKLLVRDGYDFCVAHEKDPAAFNRVLDEVYADARDQREGLIGLIKETPHRTIEGRPLLAPIDTNLARYPWGRFAEIVKDYLSGDDNDPLDHNRGLGR